MVEGPLAGQPGKVFATAIGLEQEHRWSTAVIGGQEIIQLQEILADSEGRCLSSHRENFGTDLSDLSELGEISPPIGSTIEIDVPGAITGAGQVLVATRDRLHVYRIEIDSESATLFHHDGTQAKQIPKQATSAMLSRLALEPDPESANSAVNASTLQGEFSCAKSSSRLPSRTPRGHRSWPAMGQLDVADDGGPGRRVVVSTA